ncbi:hypothetical protein V2J09_006708 [Rumex salicifolius]
MEQFRRKRQQSARAPSKVTTIANRSSDDKLIATDGPYRGSNHTTRHKCPKLESVSRSCDCDMITDKHRNAFESGQRTSKRPDGTSMKSLLADEISKETVYAKRAPGVIAKLMGLDGMPSQQSSYKQPKRSSDGFHQKTVSAGSLQHQQACNNQSCKKIARERYKDVYEVREFSRDQTDGCISQIPPTMTHAEADMTIIRQKSRDAKRLSTVEKLHDSKEIHSEPKLSDPNNYLFQKFLREPDSLLAKHLHNLHASQESHCKHVRNLKEKNILSSNLNGIGHTHIKASNKIDYSFSHEFQAGLHHQVSRKGRKASDLDRSAPFRAEANELASDARTNIVLLKPNIEVSRKSAKFSASSCSSGELLSDGDTHNSDGNKMLPTLDISSRKSRESKELAKEITRQMRKKLGETSFNMSLSEFRGYSADESSHELSGNDSSYESYTTLLSSRTSGRPSFHRKSSASRYAESSVSKEAKKRLSERWKMSHRSEEFSLGDKGSTLGQMLSFHDTDMRLPNLGGKMTQERSSSSLDRNTKLLGAIKPLGISSKDGWRDSSIGTFSRPKSLCTAFDHIGNSETCVRNDTTERFLIPKEGFLNGRNKGVKKDFSWSDASPTGIISLCDNKVNNAQGSQERRKGKKSITEAKNSSLHDPLVLESPTCRLDSMLTLDSETVSEDVIISGRMPASELILLQVIDDSSSSGLQGSTQESSKTCHIDSLQYRDAQPEPPVGSNKEANHPSPVSVLDTPSVEDLSSSSECFERVSAELHGLRMQLQLLKMETGASTTLISSDEDEGTPCSSQEANLSAGSNNWEASYMADMLADYEFDDNNPNSFMVTWHSPESPVGPHVFENLEKKYSYPVTSSPRSDRRLLFDYINSSIQEIGQRITDPSHQLVKPSKAWFEAELCKLLEFAMKLEKEESADREVVILQSKTEWMNLGESIEDLGCDIGNMLLDELVSEALAI